MALTEFQSASEDAPHEVPQWTVVRLHGDLDLSGEIELSMRLASAIDFDDAGLVVDLSGVTFMGASAVGVIVRARDFLQHRNQSLAVRDPSRCARRILAICGLDGLIEPSAELLTSDVA